MPFARHQCKNRARAQSTNQNRNPNQFLHVNIETKPDSYFRRNRPFFSKDNPMIIRSNDRKLAHAPGLVFEHIPDLHTLIHDFLV